MAGSAQTYGFSAYIDPLINEFDWSRSRISAGYRSPPCFARSRPSFIGRQIDRIGSRKMMAISAGLFGLSLIWLSQINSMLALIAGSPWFAPPPRR
ncbi:MAG: hypothetical protein R2845_15630 [Thermomicrobiales bacterium]